MHKVPVQQLVQPAAGMPLADQAGCVDLRQAPRIDPVVQQGGVLGHKGVALDMGEDWRVALSTANSVSSMPGGWMVVGNSIRM